MICSIDLGQKGGLVILTGTEMVLRVMPITDGVVDVVKLKNFLLEYSTMYRAVVVEHVHARPRMKGVMNFGKNVGRVEGVVESLGIPLIRVRPQDWQLHYGIAGKEGDTKKQASKIARKLFPDAPLLPTIRCKKPHEGLVDALLMAHYQLLRQRAAEVGS